VQLPPASALADIGKRLALMRISAADEPPSS
jgi:hypothetical protein